MTASPLYPTNSNNSSNNNSNSLYSENGLSSKSQSNGKDNSAIIPVVIDTEAQSVYAPQQRGLKAKTTALSQELSTLRSNIEYRINQLQGLIEKEGAAAERAELINLITSRMREFLSVESICQTVVEDARAALQSDRVVVYRFDPSWKGTITAESVDPQWPSAIGAEIADPCFADRYVEFYQKGRVKATPNIYEAGLTDCHIAQLEPFAVQANLVAPILVKTADNPTGYLYGLFIAHQCSQPRVWVEAEIEFFRQLATQIGYAIDQALLLQKQQSITRQAQQLNYINAQIRKSFEVEEILATAVEETRAALASDRVLVYEFDPNWKGTVIAESVDSKWPTALGALIDDPCFAQRYIQPYLRGRVAATENIFEAGLTECYLNQLAPFGVKANLVAPILVNRKLMGLLIAHQCSAPRAWTELEIDLMQKVAVQLGYALDQAYLLEQQQATAKKARLLNEITTQFRNSYSPEEVFDLLVEETRDALKADRVIIYQFSPDWEGKVVAESVESKWPIILGKQIADPCFAKSYVKPYFRGRVSTVEDFQDSGHAECYAQMLEPWGVKANIVAPIIAETKLHGLLIVHQCSGPRKWSESDINFTKQLAIQVGLALDQALLLQKQQDAAEQARRLNIISSRIRESLNYNDILSTAVEETKETLGVDRVVVNQFNPNWTGTIVAESVNAELTKTIGLPVDDFCLAENYIKPYYRGRVKVVNDVHAGELSECQVGQMETYEVKAMVVAPIIAKQKLHGLLIVHQCSETRQWKSHEIELVRQIAIQIGYALDQAFLLEEQRAATQQARVLSQISSRIRESLNSEQIFRTTVEESLSLMQADRVVVYRFDENWEGEISHEAVKPGWLKIIEMETDVPCFPAEYVESYRKGRIQVTENIATAQLSHCHKEQLQKWQVQANIVAPIVVNQKLYGLLGVHECSHPRQWTAAEVEAFKQVALQVGYALEQAQLLTQIQQASQFAEAARIQQQQEKEQLQEQIEAFLSDIEESFNGDLTVRARVSEGVMGTVADFFNATIESLQRLVLQVQSGANVVTSTAVGSEQDIQQLSNDALRQAEAINNALNQIQIMANSIRAVAENAQSAQTKVRSASEILRQGDAAMNDTVESILSIQKTVYITARKVKNLGEASTKISRVVNLINEFANQTHILALNASVESTRVAEDGQGFATVATEVRTLAEQSAGATQEIEQIVEEIQAETNEVVRAMKVGLKRVMMGTQLVKETRQTLTELVEVSHSIRELVEQIADSSNQQAQTSGELSETIKEVAGIARSTSEQSLQVANSFTRLLNVAGELQTGVSQFKVESNIGNS
ncbi:GAF domain-containing protein [Capilliphycus salinus ALCB114379]|uniref:GAF domain-containing protein n=1 Tax=Capilliphycus salinus TaxID=2768948 RepID=UPI0039A6DC36